MPRQSLKSLKSHQADAALRNLDDIRELAAESYNGPHAYYRYHAQSANNSLAAIKAAGAPLPDWLIANASYFKSCGWQFDVSKSAA